MINALIMLGFLLSGFTLSILFPVHLPQSWIDALTYFLDPLMRWDGLLPIHSWLQDAVWIFMISIYFLIYKAAIGILGLISGSGKPDL